MIEAVKTDGRFVEVIGDTFYLYYPKSKEGYNLLVKSVGKESAEQYKHFFIKKKVVVRRKCS